MKQKITNALTKHWQSTAKIVNITGLNYYDVFEELANMNEEGECERFVKGKRKQINFWRLPQSINEMSARVLN